MADIALAVLSLALPSRPYWSPFRVYTLFAPTNLVHNLFKVIVRGVYVRTNCELVGVTPDLLANLACREVVLRDSSSELCSMGISCGSHTNPWLCS